MLTTCPLCGGVGEQSIPATGEEPEYRQMCGHCQGAGRIDADLAILYEELVCEYWETPAHITKAFERLARKVNCVYFDEAEDAGEREATAPF